jgi:hypothetical protein
MKTKMEFKLKTQLSVTLVASLFMTGCSIMPTQNPDRLSSPTSSSLASPDYPAVNREITNGVLDTIAATGIPLHEWEYIEGGQFEVEEFKRLVPEARVVCGGAADDSDLYRQSVMVKRIKQATPSESGKILSNVKSAWQKDGHSSSRIGVEPGYGQMSYATENGVRIEFSSTEEQVIIVVNSPCNQTKSRGVYPSK